MKKIMLTTLLSALALSGAASANINTNYIGGGIWDGGDSTEMHLTTRLQATPVVSILGDYYDVQDGAFEIIAQRSFGRGFRVNLGATHVSYAGSGSDTDFVAGLGLRTPIGQSSVIEFAANYYDAAGGYYGLGAQVQTYISRNLALNYGYKYNDHTESGVSMSNEVRFGLVFAF
ncbi:hypothetical protein CWE09_01490 [Aliidiomarina minuta]|uniref:Outer membrane protein beta-barrel domain-containing protein n=1 Tax=Aliidiomarina minuta TaxID=880057 RepID=A0A432W5V1_9GAMM|nr:hypothetical protein [Aliidiomarina minuta]RUO25437.1 hypothetical protein CWE09_01490 [Aliidiomarina minuta]